MVIKKINKKVGHVCMIDDEKKISNDRIWVFLGINKECMKVLMTLYTCHTLQNIWFDFSGWQSIFTQNWVIIWICHGILSISNPPHLLVMKHENGSISNPFRLTCRLFPWIDVLTFFFVILDVEWKTNVISYFENVYMIWILSMLFFWWQIFTL